MYQVERHVIKDNRYEEICHKSGLLYNYCLYAFRQGVFTGNYIKEYELSTKLGKENQYDFRNLPCHVSRNVIKQVSENIKSWIRAKKEYEKHPDKFQRRPKLPNYKNGKKLNIVVFDELSCRIKEDGCVHFVKNIIKPIRIRIQITRRAIAIVRITAETNSQFFLTYFSTVICYFRGQIPM